LRDLARLPKAHLHLHFTGSMRHPTLVELAERDGIVLPDALVDEWPPQLSAADEKGWFRFQRLYDVARSVLGIAVIIAANRTRHPMDARTLARLAAQYADRGVVGFGLSNDERRGTTADFAPAFRIAERAGLALMPHGGELMGPESVRTCLDSLHADRLGHGIRSVEDPALLERIAEQGTALEVCPVSNVALGVYSDLTSVPLPQLLDAGATVALGADDPLLFGSRLGGQYATMRAAHDLSDEQLAELARMSVRASRAPSDVVTSLLSQVDGWLADDPRVSRPPA
jgi:adenosine deaminase